MCVFSFVLAASFLHFARAEQNLIDGVQNLRATATTSGVLIEWQTEGAANLVAFQVQRALSSAGSWKVLHDGWLTTAPDEVTGYTLTYLDEAMPRPDTVYRVTARSAVGDSRNYGPVAVTRRENQPAAVDQPMFSVERRRTPMQGRTPRALVSPRSSAATHAAAPSRLKIEVWDTGLYYLSMRDVATAMGWATNDLSTRLAQRQLRLSSRGCKIAYIPAPDNRGLYFFNQSRPDIYSAEEVYWLERGRGLVLPGVDGACPPDEVPGIGTFTETLHVETNINMVTSIGSDPEADYWYWTSMRAGPTANHSYSVRLPAVADGPARLSLRMLGTTTTRVSNEHHAILSLNGTIVGEPVWEGLADFTGTFDIPGGILSNGINRIRIQRPLDPGIEYSYANLDWFDIQYQRRYEADGDRLLCPGTADGPMTVSGFSDPDVLVLDVTDRSFPRPVTGLSVQSSNSAFAVSFTGAGTNAIYFACSRSAVSEVTRLTACADTGLRSSTNHADYLAFSVPSLTNALGRLMTHRRAGGWTSQVVLTQQAYDEFNYGRLSPHALRRCLAHASAEWSTPPTHVVLVGTGSFDYRDYKELGGCLVPPLMVSTPYGLFASDNQIADTQGDDGVPELAIGRLPVRTSVALSNMVDKTIAHDTASPGVWQSNVVFAADNPDKAGDFTASSEAAAGLLPEWITQQKAYLETQSVDAVRQTIRTNLNAGVVWMNYFGHGGWYGLAEERILAQGDFSSLTNRTNLGVLTAMTCLINRFEVPGAPGFSEQLLLDAPGGVAAVWSATGLSENASAEVLARALYLARYEHGIATLGEGAQRALLSGSAQRLPRFELDIMTLLGDPALPLR